MPMVRIPDGFSQSLCLLLSNRHARASSSVRVKETGIGRWKEQLWGYARQPCEAEGIIDFGERGASHSKPAALPGFLSMSM